MTVLNRLPSYTALLILALLSGCGGNSGGTLPTAAATTPDTSSSNAGSGGSTSNPGSTSGSSGTQSGGTGSGSTQSAGSLEFASAAYAPAAGSSSISLTVIRTAGSSGAVTISYTTANDTATAGTDYTTTNGTLSWADADTSAKTIQIPVGNAASFSGVRTFNVNLASPAGGAAIGSPATAVVSVVGTAVSADAMGSTGATRLLMQGTFGATLPDLASAAGQSYDAWFSGQAAASPSLELPQVKSGGTRVVAWWYNAVKGPDQLRQRMAFVLSQLLVISIKNGALTYQEQGDSYYYDLLTRNALGNYRDVLDTVSHSVEMGLYLSFFKNQKPNASTGVHADENYARELMQLFTVGLWQLNPDGSQQLDAHGNPIPTYSQSDVTNLARVLTGWGSTPQTHSGDNAWVYDLDYLNPMVCYPAYHDTDAKTIIGGVGIASGGTCDSELKSALDTLFNHPNTAPFISKQLIQRLVTSNPSAAYVSRVAGVFANNGKGVRGDLLAVAKAILTDPEASTAGSSAGAGRLREPLMRLTNLWRAFGAADSSGSYRSQIFATTEDDFGQAPLESPSVFNFYRPDYQRAGALMSAGLVVPEFQITNENTAVLLSNNLAQQAYLYVDSTGRSHTSVDAQDVLGTPGANDVVLHTAPWEAYAADAGTLTDKLNQVLMAGQMSAAMKSTIVSYINGIPATSAGTRVAEAAALIINSPQYAIQR
jgi:uncharacterized protein (DUF1800 family)